MEASTLKQAIKEAKRFIHLANAVPIDNRLVRGGPESRDYIESGKASGAAKRASMDLSRCLSDLRQGR